MRKKFREYVDETIKGEEGQVPLYRSYGVRKKVNKGVIFVNVILTKILFVLLIAFEFSVIGICSVVIFMYGGALASALVALTFTCLLVNKYTKVGRRRLGFLRKFKRFCKKNSYTIEKKRPFFASLKWNDSKEVDIVLHTGEKTYYIKYVTPKKPLSSVTFLSKREIRYTVHARKNVFSLMLGFKDKSQVLNIKFPAEIEGGEKILLVNPKPRDIFVKNSDGAIIPTGSGESIYGYTIYTGTGFVDMLKREEERKPKN